MNEVTAWTLCWSWGINSARDSRLAGWVRFVSLTSSVTQPTKDVFHLPLLSAMNVNTKQLFLSCEDTYISLEYFSDNASS